MGATGHIGWAIVTALIAVIFIISGVKSDDLLRVTLGIVNLMFAFEHRLMYEIKRKEDGQ